MKWESIRGAGHYVEINNIDGENGKVKAHKFLVDMHKEFAKNCIKYFDEVEDLPYIYGERQVHSTVFPAISKIATATLAEQPIERVREESKIKKTSQGRIDYWVKYKNNVMLIELKHSWINYSSAKLNNYDSKKTWDDLLTQLKGRKNKDARNLASGESNVIKMGLMIMPLCCNSKSLESIESFEKVQAIRMLKDIPKKDFNYDWGCFWYAPKEIQGYYTKDSNKVHTKFPGIVLLAKVESIGKGTL